MNYFEFIKEKPLFLEHIKNGFDIVIKEEKIDLESFIEKKNLYLDLLNKTFGNNMVNNISIDYLQDLEGKLKNKRDLIDDYIMLALCYVVGEVILQIRGGNWDIGKLKKDWAYGFPIILNWGKDKENSMRLCPIEWIFSYKYNRLRLGTFSKMILQN